MNAGKNPTNEWNHGLITVAGDATRAIPGATRGIHAFTYSLSEPGMAARAVVQRSIGEPGGEEMSQTVSVMASPNRSGNVSRNT
jgi:hypothetical protein